MTDACLIHFRQMSLEDKNILTDTHIQQQSTLTYTHIRTEIHRCRTAETNTQKEEEEEGNCQNYIRPYFRGSIEAKN